MEFHIKPLGRTCAATQQPLAPGETVYSVLVDQEGEQLRLDFSQQGWTGPPEGTIGQWMCVVPPPESTRPKPLDANSLLEYFEKLVDESNPVQEQFCYVLALLLLQKRRLKLDGSRRDGDIEYLQFIGSQGEGPYEVRDQNLSAEEVATLQAALSQQLSQARDSQAEDPAVTGDPQTEAA